MARNFSLYLVQKLDKQWWYIALLSVLIYHLALVAKQIYHDTRIKFL